LLGDRGAVPLARRLEKLLALMTIRKRAFWYNKGVLVLTGNNYSPVGLVNRTYIFP
jgi:hypothetical protein